MKYLVPTLIAPAALAAALTGCSSHPVAAAVTVTASPSSVTYTPTPAPSPSVVTRTVQASKAAPTRTVVVQQLPAPVHAAPQYPVYYTPSYYGPTYGDYTLTHFAYPGPIHSYSSPTDTSSWVETIQANAVVPILCSVIGENVNGDHVWDWDGSGWIWDSMVQMFGAEPPRC